jgi:hypothetical protein
VSASFSPARVCGTYVFGSAIHISGPLVRIYGPLNRIVKGRGCGPAPGRTPEAIRVAKPLRTEGRTVSFEDEKFDRGYVPHDAGEFWLPILAFGAGITSSVLSGALVEPIKNYMPSRSGSDQQPGVEQPLLHLEVIRGDERNVLDGSVQDVLTAAEQLRNGGTDEPEGLPSFMSGSASTRLKPRGRGARTTPTNAPKTIVGVV